MLFGIILHLLTRYPGNMVFIVPLGTIYCPLASRREIVGVSVNNKLAITLKPVNWCVL
jgi:hypothetical protein